MKRPKRCNQVRHPALRGFPGVTAGSMVTGKMRAADQGKETAAPKGTAKRLPITSLFLLGESLRNAALES